MRLRLWAALGVAIAGTCTCTTTEIQPTNQPVAAELAHKQPRSQPTNPEAVGSPPADTKLRDPAGPRNERAPRLLVQDPEELREIEALGLDFGRVALGARPGELVNAEEYARHPAYRNLVDVVGRDLAEAGAGDRNAGVGMRYAHRRFDLRWLTSERFRFELVGIVNRIDRRAFAPETCGELRWIYRLMYRTEVMGQVIASRVPMTVNVVRWLQKDNDPSCRRWVSAWQFPETYPAAEWFEEGGLFADIETHTVPKSVELNLQSERWPSTVRPNMAGHAEYLLRVFRPVFDSGGKLLRFAESELENTPDVKRIAASPSLQKEMLDWLLRPEVLQAVDQGTVLLPERFLARRAQSFAPHGLARRANRLYRQLFRDADFEGHHLGGYRSFADAASLLRRLDGLTCPGCHQVRSVAGFHFLGEDDPERVADAIFVAHSAHVTHELERRQGYLAALLEEASPNEFRPSAERGGPGDYGAHCGLDPDGPYGNWDCAPGHHCAPLNDLEIGQCQPVAVSAGDICESGVMQSSADRRRDFVRLRRPSGCSERSICERNGVGFPGGMCSSSCDALSEHEVCGAIAQLVEFNGCLARRIPFERCILEHTREGALRRCSTAAPCREDYVCARLPNGEGGCIPPYFLFQLRVDGHVLE